MSTDNDNENTPKPHPRLQTCLDLYMEGIRDGHAKEAIYKYTGDVYKQHSTGVKDGQEGFLEFFLPFLERCTDRDIQVKRAWYDETEQKAFCHVFQDINKGQAKWVTTDFFDFDANHKVIEHWDVIAPFNESNPSGHSNVDGPSEITDLDKTAENKQLVRDLLKNALMEGGDPTTLEQYISKDCYIQHNKDVPDGLEHFQKLATQPHPPLTYKRIVLCVGSGNFVATLCEAHWKDDTTDQDYAQVDIFRIENGKVVEHWDK
mmetsp:Transcript_12301/g.34112  ORF Transcript_12301/g.34112 Transcript_12301/m.34112 type:complete len:261 (-) Transcript_12301:64-846(-)